MGSADKHVARDSMLLVLTVVCLLAASWLFFIHQTVAAEPSPTTAGSHFESPSPRAGGNSPTVPRPTVVELVREEAPNSELLLIVGDERGNRIAGATVALCPAGGARNLGVKDRVGLTNSAGELTISLAGISGKEDHSLLVVGAKGFVNEAIDCPRLPGRCDVVLRAGSELQVQCMDFGGLPLSRVDVAISLVLFPASGWRDTPTWQREVGSDAVTTIRYGSTDATGTVTFDGLLPGSYFVRAESEGYLLASANDATSMLLELVGSASRHVLVLGVLCVAALETNVPSEDVVEYTIQGDQSHVLAGLAQEALEVRRRKIEQAFPSCHATVSLARTEAGGLGKAIFRYSTLSYGSLVHEVSFVAMPSFVKPDTFVATGAVRRPTGEVVIRVVGDLGVGRKRLRAELKRSKRSVTGIACVEGEVTTVPATSYVVDVMDRELWKAIEKPADVVVRAQLRSEVVLKIRDGLVPVTVNVAFPSLLREQSATITISAHDQIASKGRAASGEWVTWVPPGAYDVTVEAVGCKLASAKHVALAGQAGSVGVKLEAHR